MSTRQAARLENKARRAATVERIGDVLCWLGVGSALLYLIAEVAGWLPHAHVIMPLILVSFVGMVLSVGGALAGDRYTTELDELDTAAGGCPAWHNAGMGRDADGTFWRIGCALGAGHSGHLHQDASGEVFVQVLDTKQEQEAKEQ